ncbi:MAG: hypothetical protein U0414_32170 [Polyangiaceae bacterium]
MADTKLGREVFLALAAIGWADGELHPDEADAIVKTALEEGLELWEIEDIERATKEPIELALIPLERMTKADRLFVYAVASWMTTLDGKVDDAEIAALDRLGMLLRIPDRPREHAAAIAREIAQLEGGDKPAAYDLKKLRRVLTERLEEARKARIAAKEEDPD